MKSVIYRWMSADLLASMLLNSLTAFAQETESENLPILLKWSGDYPVSELHRLTRGQRESRVGYIPDSETFMAVWQAFKPGEKVPEVAFGQHLVIFARNVDFYNRMSIAVFPGDRIAPQNPRISNGVIIADYADRQEGEPMTTSPSVGKSAYLTIRKGVLEEIKPLS